MKRSNSLKAFNKLGIDYSKLIIYIKYNLYEKGFLKKENYSFQGENISVELLDTGSTVNPDFEKNLKKVI